MQHVVKDTVEFRHSEMPKVYWQKHKKPSVDLMTDNPFTIDRQLEDQRYLQEFNKNPRANLSTKVEKTRSEKIIAKVGACSVLATKAKVLNKFVRDASGVNAYAMVPPPRQKDTSHVQEDFDPETHPLVKPYRLESQRKPVMCSFGHRPKSASRTFYPATMKVRLEHGEVAPVQAGGKTGVGLSVATLGKLLHAPRLLYPNQLEADVEEEEERKRFEMGYDLDDTSLQTSDTFGTGPNSQPQSQSQRRTAKTGSKKKPAMSKQSSTVSIFDDDSVYSTLPQDPKKARPVWDEGFHNIPANPVALYALKSSGGMNNPNLPLADRLHRFSKLTVSERTVNPFCAEKQKNDWEERRTGQPIKLKKASPVKGTTAYFDPLEQQFNRVKALNKRDRIADEEHRKKLDYISAVRQIPDVPYFPGDVADTLRTNTASPIELEAGGAIGEAAFNSSFRTKDVTSMALKGLYSSNFEAPKHIDTRMNTSMDNYELDIQRKDERNKKLGSYELTEPSLSKTGTAKKSSTASPSAASRKGRRSSNGKTMSRKGSEKVLYSFEHAGSGSVSPNPMASVGSYSQTNLTRLQPLNPSMARSAPQLAKPKTTGSGMESSTISDIPMESTVTFDDSQNVSFGSGKQSANRLGRIQSDAMLLDRTLKEAKKGNVNVLYQHYMIDDERTNSNPYEHELGKTM